MDDHPQDQCNVVPISAKPPARLPNGSLPNLSAQAQAMLVPVSPVEAVALVASCLALVRAVGMSQREADDWLRVAAGDVAHYPPDILANACREARRTVTHHSQIVPAIVRFADERLAVRRRAAELRETGAQQTVQLVQNYWKPSPDDLNQAKAEVLAAFRTKGEGSL